MKDITQNDREHRRVTEPNHPQPRRHKPQAAPNYEPAGAGADEPQAEVHAQPRKNEILVDGYTFTVIHSDGKSFSSFRISIRESDGSYFIWQVGRGPKSNLYVGELDPSTGNVFQTPASGTHEYIGPMTRLNEVLPRIWDGAPLPPGASVLPARKCERCDGRLTQPKSIEQGLGPTCARRNRPQDVEPPK